MQCQNQISGRVAHRKSLSSKSRTKGGECSKCVSELQCDRLLAAIVCDLHLAAPSRAQQNSQRALEAHGLLALAVRAFAADPAFLGNNDLAMQLASELLMKARYAFAQCSSNLSRADIDVMRIRQGDRTVTDAGVQPDGFALAVKTLQIEQRKKKQSDFLKKKGSNKKDKSNDVCKACGQRGHWASDDACPLKQGGKGQQRAPPGHVHVAAVPYPPAFNGPLNGVWGAQPATMARKN